MERIGCFSISASGIDHETRRRQHCQAIDAARRANVGHLYYTSLAAGTDTTAVVMRAHLDTEAYLKGADLPYTILRNGIYTESWRNYLGDISDGEAAVPHDGPIS